jgi:hypothetical protein
MNVEFFPGADLFVGVVHQDQRFIIAHRCNVAQFLPPVALRGIE